MVLERPRGLLPSRLRVASSTPFFQRAVEVWDDGAGARDDVLGRGRVFRVEAAATVEELEVEVAPASGEALRVVIENGSSPALADLAFVALLPRPALLFALPSTGAMPMRMGGAEATTAILRFGGGRAFRPRYDVASLPPQIPAVGERAQVAEVLYDAARLPAAVLGAIGANPMFDPQPALAWAQRAGASLDPRLWSHRRGLEARPSPEGLSRMRLGVADLGVARPDLADLRILDGEQRQWAYLLERGAASETLALASEGPRSRDGVSSWTLAPPAAPATADQLTLEIAVPYFDRPFELRARLEGEDERVIASGRLARAAGDPRPVLIAFCADAFRSARAPRHRRRRRPARPRARRSAIPGPGGLLRGAGRLVLGAGGSARGDSAPLRPGAGAGRRARGALGAGRGGRARGQRRVQRQRAVGVG